ncbi:MAG TPA: ParB N-terminal domain-containing protein [Thermoplasmata archaeon]|nr:ParB N-terminal domain-containing protein [Thermoplasmata archaeon]
MTDDAVVFALVPLASLKAHEAVVPGKVRHLVAELRRTGVFQDPIWVARGSGVILNGHHRAAALKRLGAERVPAWVIDYDAGIVRLDRWTPGPPIAKDEVVRRGERGELFPPQTTRHALAVSLPARPTPLADLLPSAAAPRRSTQARRAGSARSRAGSAPPG